MVDLSILEQIGTSLAIKSLTASSSSYVLSTVGGGSLASSRFLASSGVSTDIAFMI